jgi:hypothetical protein
MLKILILILLPISCGPSDQRNKRSSSEEVSVNSKYLELIGTISQISNMVYSDFAACSGVNANDALINKICKVAQAANVESRISLKAEVSTAISYLQDKAINIDKDLQSLYGAIDTIQTTLTSLDSRLTTLENQVTDITEGFCLRSRNSNTSLTGVVATLLWDNSIRMNSSYCTYNIPTAEFTIQKAGWYEVSYKANFSHTNGNNTLLIRTWILLNNATQINRSRVYVETRSNTQGEFGTNVVVFFQQFAINDIIELQTDAASANNAFGAGGAAYDLIGNESSFSVRYVDDI